MELTWPVPLLFDPKRERARERQVRASIADQPRQEPRLRCGACNNIVTYPIQRISVLNCHEHSFTNPQGITYHIGCFREAAGCTATGTATTEFTWFAGYAWRVALCSNCQTHLGWRFQSSRDYFHGLIMDRLVLEDLANRDARHAG